MLQDQRNWNVDKVPIRCQNQKHFSKTGEVNNENEVFIFCPRIVPARGGKKYKSRQYRSSPKDLQENGGQLVADLQEDRVKPNWEGKKYFFFAPFKF
jgi:hypothetical protein